MKLKLFHTEIKRAGRKVKREGGGWEEEKIIMFLELYLKATVNLLKTN